MPFRVGEIKLLADASPTPVRFALDRPQQDTILHTPTLQVGGWIVCEGRPVDQVVAEWTDQAGTSGDAITIPVIYHRPDVVAYLGLPQDQESRVGFDHRLPVPKSLEEAGPARLRLSYSDDGTQIRLAEIDLAAMSPGHHPQAQLQPLAVTSLGRCGTTLLLRAIGQHPHIVAVRQYPYECALASHVAALAARAASFPSVAHLPSGHEDFLIGSYAEVTRGHFIGVLDGFYQRVAQLNGQATPAFFVEKMLPATAQSQLESLYGQRLREIILVRDFRDMVCSVLAFNSKRGYQRFSREHFGTDEDYIFGVGASVRRLLEDWQERQEYAALVRYEDLVAAPEITLHRLFERLGIETNSDQIRTMIDACRPADDAELIKHMTSASADQSVGRWKRDLSPELLRAAELSFGDALQAFGYSTTNSYTASAGLSQSSASGNGPLSSLPWKPGPRYGSGAAEVMAVRIVNEDGHDIEQIASGLRCQILVVTKVVTAVADPIVGLSISSESGQLVYSIDTHAAGVRIGSRWNGEVFTVEFAQVIRLGAGTYRVSASVGEMRSDEYVPSDHIEDRYQLIVLPVGPSMGMVNLQSTVSLLEASVE